jgi:tetratricopeptide (TPR) repeat protein
MFVVTFYSYKGGVGRTSALVNVACRLARRGKRVFVLDFDLEAPGVDAYGLTKTEGSTPGLVEYISTFTATGKVPPLRDFVLDASHPGTTGKLFLMPAGKKDDAYKSALGQLDWKLLYRQRKGYLLVENLKGAIDELFRPEYLLVDSRTGLTDVSGICTLQLPHLVVLLFSLNEQNVAGVSTILRTIKGNRLNREIATLLVASPVPDMPEWVEARATRFESARLAMGNAADVVLPYDPFLAFRESIVDGQGQGHAVTHLGRAYDSLTDKIIAKNVSDVQTLLGRATQLRNEGQHELAESHYRGVVDAKPDSVEAWLEFGKFERLRGKLSPACEYFEKAYALDPTDCEVLAQLASTYAYVDKVRCGRYYQEFLKLDENAQRIFWVSTALRNVGLANLALEGFLRSTILNDKDVSSFIHLGEMHMQLHHYRQAADAYRRGLELDPNSMICAYNLGAALHRLEDHRASEYYAKAIEVFEQTKRPMNDKSAIANQNEAMSHAYLAVGKVERAVQLLEDALTVAKELAGGRIFSSLKYEYISQEKFVSEVLTLLEIAKRRLGKIGSVKGKGNEGLPN